MTTKMPVAAKARRPKTVVQPVAPVEPSLFSICVVVFLSGIPALIYQNVWQRMLVLHSGVGTASVATIVTAYLLGLGIGSWLGARFTCRITARRAAQIVIGLELAVGAYAVLSPTLLYDLLYWKLGWMYKELWLAALMHLATLVVPTMLMGATLPLLTRALLSHRPELAKSLGLVYGSNTMGAAMGALLAPWFFIRYTGIVGALSIGAACNLLVAARMWQFSKMTSPTDALPGRKESSASSGHHEPAVQPFSLPLGMLLTFFTGLIAIGLEILWFRIVDVGVKSTAFTFGTVLCIYLLCMGVGSIIASFWTSRIRRPLDTFLWAQLVVIGSATISLLILVLVPSTLGEQIPVVGRIYAYWSEGIPANPNVVSWKTTLGLYGLFPFFLMGPSALAMGFSFTMLQLGTQQLRDDAGYRVGVLQAANICGCALGSLFVGLVLVDALGTLGAWRFLIVASLVFPCVGALMCQRKRAIALSGALLVVAAAWFPSNDSIWARLHGLTDQSNGFIAEDVTGVSVLQRPTESSEVWSLLANGKLQSNLPFGGIHSKLGVLPVILHPQPQKAAIIGLGSGDTAWAAGCDPQLKELRVFEILTSEIRVLHDASTQATLGQLKRFLDDTRFRIDGDDARYKLMTSSDTYDIIEADAIRPNGAYAGYLYSEEFFRLCASRLRPGGLMCSWSPTPGTYATFCKAFPHVVEFDGGNVLIGSREPIAIDLPKWKQRLEDPRVREYLGEKVQAECLSSLETAQPAVPGPNASWINTDLFPFDEFH